MHEYISAEDITVALQEMDYDIVSVKEPNVSLQKEGSHTPPSPPSQLL
jgi:hypothetical protein